MKRRKRERRTRVSIFAAGVPLNQRPVKHFACKASERAGLIYEQWVAKIDGEAVARVVLHEGNLKHNSYRILADATVQKEAPKRIAQCNFMIPCGATVELPEGLYRPGEVAGGAAAEVVESWAGGLHALRFPDYPNIVDYTVTEAKRMKVIIAPQQP